jgi:hypothetical protein
MEQWRVLCSEFVPRFGSVQRLIKVRAIVALVLLPVSRPARRHWPRAAFRAGYAMVRSFLVYLRVMLTVSRFSHDFLVEVPRKAWRVVAT